MKSSYLLLFLVVINFSKLYAQEPDSLNKYLFVSVIRGEELEKELKQLADSINHFSGEELPSFLKDECLDWQGRYWEGLHSPTSVRWEVLKRVENKRALRELLQIGSENLKKRCSWKKLDVYPFLEIPDINKSFYELIKLRLTQL